MHLTPVSLPQIVRHDVGQGQDATARCFEPEASVHICHRVVSWPATPIALERHSQTYLLTTASRQATVELAYHPPARVAHRGCRPLLPLLPPSMRSASILLRMPDCRCKLLAGARRVEHCANPSPAVVAMLRSHGALLIKELVLIERSLYHDVHIESHKGPNMRQCGVIGPRTVISALL
ncbi:hypothetical protein WOLCODRAFT_164563 [Wolfiporia cocos MD-104 SS10]|uniref:Uncharacterized protein n=1 Tax=Wolfiporia cocos (strain MD-104) TaxID=742152 RepID=A0A2H3K0G0_WOLCO|nr:hypothetical protein WOLCODRAFT_164563 [Wolfiporia cocos MD-104 SS10]